MVVSGGSLRLIWHALCVRLKSSQLPMSKNGVMVETGGWLNLPQISSCFHYLRDGVQAHALVNGEDLFALKVIGKI